jgi:hypothetical protein
MALLPLLAYGALLDVVLSALVLQGLVQYEKLHCAAYLDLYV